jgi:hypothetical protein
LICKERPQKGTKDTRDFLLMPFCAFLWLLSLRSQLVSGQQPTANSFQKRGGLLGRGSTGAGAPVLIPGAALGSIRACRRGARVPLACRQCRHAKQTLARCQCHPESAAPWNRGRTAFCANRRPCATQPRPVSRRSLTLANGRASCSHCFWPCPGYRHNHQPV